MKRGGRSWQEPELCRGCRGTVRPWLAFCDGCWGRLPGDHKRAISKARDTKAPHIVSAAVRLAGEWLRAHTPAALAARVTGERE